MEEYREVLLESLKKGQNPPLAVLYCSDSRVDYNMFNVGPGSIFTIENAGNVFGLGDESISSLAYALSHFSVNGYFNILVMGHTLCGAVSAACAKHPHYDDVSPGSLLRLLKYISPAVDRAKSMDGDLVQNAIQENVLLQMSNIAEFFKGLHEVKAPNITLYGAIYELSANDDILPYVWKMTLCTNGKRIESPNVEKITLSGKGRNIDTLFYDVMKIDKSIMKRGLLRKMVNRV